MNHVENFSPISGLTGAPGHPQVIPPVRSVRSGVLGIQWLAVGCGLALVPLLGGLWSWAEAQVAFQDAQAQWAESIRLAEDIQRLQQLPTQARSSSISSAVMTQQLEQALLELNLPLEVVRGIAPQPASRFGQTAYKIQTTLVTLDSLTLPQVAGILQKLSTLDPALSISQITFQTPTSLKLEPGTGELWQVELTLTYRIFEPKFLSPT